MKTLAAAGLSLAIVLGLPDVSHAVVLIPPSSGTLSAALADLDGDLIDDSTSTSSIDDFNWTNSTSMVQAAVPDALSSSAMTTMGVNRAEAIATLPGSAAGQANALSLWFDKFTVTGGSGSGSARVSATVTATIQDDFKARGLYYLLKLTPEQLMDIQSRSPESLATDYFTSGIPSSMVVISARRTESNGPVNVNATLKGTLSFEYDQPFYLASMLMVEAQEMGAISAINSVHFGLSLVDPLASYDSDSNTVYAASVPEPETYALILAGLGVVAVGARRQRRTRLE